MAIRLGIVDDHPLFRLGLKRALEREPDIDTLWELDSVAGLDAILRKSPVDVILMDIYLGVGKDGMAAIRETTQNWPGLKVAAISGSLDNRLVPATKRAGAHVFLPKTLPIAEMVSSIRRLVAVSASGSSNGAAKPRRVLRAGLSPREGQVLEHLRVGRTNREIAARLGISVTTVNKHVHRVLSVLNVSNRTQAAAAHRDIGD